jgi:8-amino-3,8-dideoxy-alpha-D-manno-octulosonate transaminase
MGEEEIEAATRVLRSRSLFRYYGIDLQAEASRFESEFAAFVGTRYAIAVSSGTGALHTAMAALGVGPGKEVIIPAYLWVSVAGAVVNLGAIPVLADIDDSFCMSPAAVESRISPRTAGIVLVHMSGAPGDAPAVRELADRHGLFLLEDCAQCAGGSIGGRSAGTFGHMGVFSFQMNKNMTSGEGGAVVTSDQRLYRRAFACHDLGYPRDENGRLVFHEPDLCLWGMGYRIDELRAAILRVQLRKLPETVRRMRASKQRIRQALESINGVQLRRLVDPQGDTGSFLITTYDSAARAREVHEALLAEGIRTHPQGVSNIIMTGWGLHIYYNIASLAGRRSGNAAGAPWSLAENSGSRYEYGKGTCPVADSLFERSVLLPIPSNLTQQDEDDIILAFRRTTVK